MMSTTPSPESLSPESGGTTPPRDLGASTLPSPTRTESKSRWSGYAYLFHRPDNGATNPLAPTGQIGGSQAAARIAYRLDDAGRIAVAARVATAYRGTGQTETALGLDLVPAPGLRFAIERRIPIGTQGRDAWSAYASGGVYRALSPRILLDGYAQAGLVGARSRDPFADGGLRIAHRTPLAPAADLHVGAGLWGAAQPGAARLDLGPRAAVMVRTGRVPLTLAAEDRIRIAGRARPGTGLAVTLAGDF
jgi:hypothetical protein